MLLFLKVKISYQDELKSKLFYALFNNEINKNSRNINFLKFGYVNYDMINYILGLINNFVFIIVNDNIE